MNARIFCGGIAMEADSPFGASKEQIRSWFLRGMAENNTHMIVVCDDFSYEDYPV